MSDTPFPQTSIDPQEEAGCTSTQTDQDVQAVLAKYTATLAKDNLTTNKRIELLNNRAALYGHLQDYTAQIADLQTANRLLELQAKTYKQALDERDAELILLNTVAEALNNQLDIQAVYDLIGDRAREIFSAQGVMIIIRDRKNNLIQTPYLSEKGTRFYLPDRPMADHDKNFSKSFDENQNDRCVSSFQ